VDAGSGGEQLRLNLSTQDQLFNSMDPAPFRERDLDSEVVAYIVDWAEELPARASLSIAVSLASDPVTGKTCEVLRDAVQRSFRRRAGGVRRQLKRLFRTGRISLVIGLAFLAMATVIGESVAEMVLKDSYRTIIHESIVIGGWVALWYPINIFLYEWWPIWKQARLYDRLARVDVRVLAPASGAAGAASA
jgi:hypothetical protein